MTTLELNSQIPPLEALAYDQGDSILADKPGLTVITAPESVHSPFSVDNILVFYGSTIRNLLEPTKESGTGYLTERETNLPLLRAQIEDKAASLAQFIDLGIDRDGEREQYDQLVSLYLHLEAAIARGAGANAEAIAIGVENATARLNRIFHIRDRESKIADDTDTAEGVLGLITSTTQEPNVNHGNDTPIHVEEIAAPSRVGSLLELIATAEAEFSAVTGDDPLSRDTRRVAAEKIIKLVGSYNSEAAEKLQIPDAAREVVEQFEDRQFTTQHAQDRQGSFKEHPTNALERRIAQTRARLNNLDPQANRDDYRVLSRWLDQLVMELSKLNVQANRISEEFATTTELPEISEKKIGKIKGKYNKVKGFISLRRSKTAQIMGALFMTSLSVSGSTSTPHIQHAESLQGDAVAAMITGLKPGDNAPNENEFAIGSSNNKTEAIGHAMSTIMDIVSKPQAAPEIEPTDYPVTYFARLWDLPQHAVMAKLREIILTQPDLGLTWLKATDGDDGNDELVAVTLDPHTLRATISSDTSLVVQRILAGK